MKWLTALPLLILSASSHAVALAGDFPVFTDPVEAVIAAADHFNPLSIHEDREYMGAVYRVDEGYSFSVTRGQRGSDTISMAIDKERLKQVVAFWHTHGGAAPQHRYFSSADTGLVERLQRPLYLADYTGYLKVFMPGARTLSVFAARRLGLPSQPGFATGRTVRDQYGRSVKIATRRSRASS